MQEKTIKLIAIFFILLIIVDLVLFLIGRIDPLTFWIVIILCALVAYKGLPMLKSK